MHVLSPSNVHVHTFFSILVRVFVEIRLLFFSENVQQHGKLNWPNLIYICRTDA